MEFLSGIPTRFFFLCPLRWYFILYVNQFSDRSLVRLVSFSQRPFVSNKMLEQSRARNYKDLMNLLTAWLLATRSLWISICGRRCLSQSVAFGCLLALTVMAWLALLNTKSLHYCPVIFLIIFCPTSFATSSLTVSTSVTPVAMLQRLQ